MLLLMIPPSFLWTSFFSHFYFTFRKWILLDFVNNLYFYLKMHDFHFYGIFLWTAIFKWNVDIFSNDFPSKSLLNENFNNTWTVLVGTWLGRCNHSFFDPIDWEIIFFSFSGIILMCYITKPQKQQSPQQFSIIFYISEALSLSILIPAFYFQPILISKLT